MLTEYAIITLEYSTLVPATPDMKTTELALLARVRLIYRIKSEFRSGNDVE